MSKSTTIVTTTTALSAIATEISSDTSGRTPSKQHLLGVFARGIAGPKHDWGLLTGSKKPVIQKGIPEARLADLRALSRAAVPSAPARDLLRFDPDREGITIRADLAELYTPEMAAYYGSKLTGDLICITEDFSTDPDHNDGDVQLMMEPASLHVSPDGPTIFQEILWAGTPESIERTGAAYFAASASETVNILTRKTISEWPEDYCGYHFTVYHLAHAVIVAPENPFSDFVDLEENEQAKDEVQRLKEIDPCHEPEEDVDELYGFDGAFRIFIDQTLDADGRAAAVAQVEDLLIRLANYYGLNIPRYTNIQVNL